MSGGFRSIWNDFARAIDRVFDAFSARPLGLAVFAASLVLLVYLQVGLQGSLRAQAIASFTQEEYGARVCAQYVVDVVFGNVSQDKPIWHEVYS